MRNKLRKPCASLHVVCGDRLASGSMRELNILPCARIPYASMTASIANSQMPFRVIIAWSQ